MPIRPAGGAKAKDFDHRYVLQQQAASDTPKAVGEHLVMVKKTATTITTASK